MGYAKLKWRKEADTYHAKCGEFSFIIQPWSYPGDLPFCWRVDLNGRTHVNEKCKTINQCKTQAADFMENEIYKMINEANMDGILDGG